MISELVKFEGLLITLECLEEEKLGKATFGCSLSPSAKNSAVPLDTVASPCTSLLQAFCPMPNIKHLQKDIKHRSNKDQCICDWHVTCKINIWDRQQAHTVGYCRGVRQVYYITMHLSHFIPMDALGNECHLLKPFAF